MPESLLKRTLKLALPAVLESLLTSAVFLVDALMVARVGQAELAAAGLAGVVMWRLRSVAGVLQIGSVASVARRWGEGNYAAARVVHTHSAWLSFLAGVLCLAAYPLVPFFMGVLNAEGELRALASEYFCVILLVFPFRLASLTMAANIRSAGDTRTPMLVTTLAILLNVLLNTVFIFGWYGGPEWGLFGAGLGTALAMFVEFLLLTIVGLAGTRRLDTLAGALSGLGGLAVLKFARSGFRLRIPDVTRTIFRISFESFWEEIAVSIGFLGFIGMIADFGEVALAVHTACVRVESFSFQAGFGFAIAAATLVGQALGAKDVPLARRCFSLCLTLAAIAMGAFGVVYILFPHFFLAWFAPAGDEAFLALGAQLFILAGVQQPWLGATMVLSGGLKGAGETRSPLIAQLVGTIGIRLGIGYVLAYPLGMGVVGIYWATCIDWSLRSVVLGYLIWKGRWERVEA